MKAFHGSLLSVELRPVSLLVVEVIIRTVVNKLPTAEIRFCLSSKSNMENDEGIPSYLSKKRTIMKDRVGCVRTTVYDLPAEQFVYGLKANDLEAEGAGDSKSPYH